MRRVDAARRLARRHRRPIAAVLAGVAALVGLSAVRAEPAVPTSPQPQRGLAIGEVAVPVQLSSPTIAQSLVVGDLIDVVRVSADAAEQPHAEVVAPRARVIGVSGPGSLFGSGSPSIVLLAVDEAAGLRISSVASEGPVSVLIRTLSGRG